MALVINKSNCNLKEKLWEGDELPPNPTTLDFFPGNLDDILINAELPPEEHVLNIFRVQPSSRFLNVQIMIT